LKDGARSRSLGPSSRPIVVALPARTTTNRDKGNSWRSGPVDCRRLADGVCESWDHSAVNAVATARARSPSRKTGSKLKLARIDRSQRQVPVARKSSLTIIRFVAAQLMIKTAESNSSKYSFFRDKPRFDRCASCANNFCSKYNDLGDICQILSSPALRNARVIASRSFRGLLIRGMHFPTAF